MDIEQGSVGIENNAFDGFHRLSSIHLEKANSTTAWIQLPGLDRQFLLARLPRSSSFGDWRFRCSPSRPLRSRYYLRRYRPELASARQPHVSELVQRSLLAGR